MTEEHNTSDYHARIERLKPVFIERFWRFARVRPNWDKDYGLYELFCCEEALKIIDACPTSEEVAAFCALPLPEQKKKIPTLDYDEHSGNTFYSACMLASVYRTDPKLIPLAHGALHALTGCKEYGCYAAYPDEHDPERT